MPRPGLPGLPAPPLVCRCWALYFEYESEFAGWQQLYVAGVDALRLAEEAVAAGVAAAANDDAAAAQQRLAELAQQTLPLLQAMLGFLEQRGFDSLLGAAPETAGTAALPAELAVVVGPDAGPDTAAEVQQGAAFAAFSGAEEQQGQAAALAAALAAAAGGLHGAAARQLAVAAGPAPDDMPGLVSGGPAGKGRHVGGTRRARRRTAGAVGWTADAMARSSVPALLLHLATAPVLPAAAVAVECGSAEALEAAALLLARALKGSLPAAGARQLQATVGPLLVGAEAGRMPPLDLNSGGTNQGRLCGLHDSAQPARTAQPFGRCPFRLLPPRQAANVDAPPAASAALCRAICYPRLALKCAALREALAFMGHSGREGEEVGAEARSRAAPPPASLAAAALRKEGPRRVPAQHALACVPHDKRPACAPPVCPATPLCSASGERRRQPAMRASLPAPQLVVLAAQDDLAPLFSAAELAELLQSERAAVVLQMRNHEQQQERQQPADGERQQQAVEEAAVEEARRSGPA